MSWGNEKRKANEEKRNGIFGGFNVHFLACTKESSAIPVYQKLLLQAFRVCRFRYPKEKIRNFKIEGALFSYSFYVAPYCSHVLWPYLPLFSQAWASFPFGSSYTFIWPSFCFSKSPRVQLRGLKITEQSAIAPHSSPIWSTAIGLLLFPTWRTLTLLFSRTSSLLPQ